jgi:hypothetical protein
MRTSAPTFTQPRSVGVDTAIGQIDLLGEAGEILKSWRIRTPRCTIGSGSECSVQIVADNIASLHATLIFGKKHTLLRSVGPTQISNRHVREWLIDVPTEIVIGSRRLVIHPSLGVLATVVHAENLLERTALLCKEPTPAATEPRSQSPAFNAAPNANPIDASRLDAIESLLQTLKSSLERIQTTLCTDDPAKPSSIVESVTLEMDEFGKRLFTNLNSQLSSQSVAQESLFTNLADQFTTRFVSIDEQLSRFNDTSSQQNASLQELLKQATDEQYFIETQFQEVIGHRNELLDAVHVLRSEIATAYSNERAENSGTSYAVGTPTESYSASVTDQQLADSLEQAQTQIQQLNAQLRSLEFERDSAQERIEILSQASSTNELTSSSTYQTDAYPTTTDYIANDNNPANNDSYLTNNDTYQNNSDYQDRDRDAGGPTTDYFQGFTQDSPPEVDTAYSAYQGTADDEIVALSDGVGNPVSAQVQQLPSWFRQDEEPAPENAFEPPSQYSSENSGEFARPDFNNYSDDRSSPSHESSYANEPSYESPSSYSSEGNYPSESIASEEVDQAYSAAQHDSMVDRLQRMLGTAKLSQQTDELESVRSPRESERWSQRYSEQTNDSNAANDEVPDDLQSSEFATQSPPSEPVASSQLHSLPARNEQSEIETHHDDSSNSESGGDSESGGEEESIEAYMQRLLNRVRGGAEPEKFESVAKTSKPETISTTASSRPKSKVAASMGLDMQADAAPVAVEKLSEAAFVPRQQAPEQRNELDALRELANTNARRAISRSDNRKTNSAFYIKLGITALAVTSGVALFLFNGLTINAPFAGMVSAFIVALLWGYDCINHFKRMQNSGLHQATSAQTAAGQSIPVGTPDESGWRPTPA